MPILVGVTGGIGSGKSLVCRIFHELGAPVYNADSCAKELMATDSILTNQIKEQFGKSAYDGNGKVDRAYLAKTVFSNPDQLEKLNHLVHPVVRRDFERWVKQNDGEHYVIKEAALLFEAGSFSDLDKIVVVSAPETLRMKRVIERDSHRSPADVLAIFRNQLQEDEKLKRADFVIVNDESELIIPQVIRLHEQFLATKKAQT